MQYDRVIPVAMTGELHIPLFCAPQRMDAEIPVAMHIGGYFSAGGSSADYRARYTKRRGADAERGVCSPPMARSPWQGRAERPLLAPRPRGYLPWVHVTSAAGPAAGSCL